MSTNNIILKFKGFTLNAELFDNDIAGKFAAGLPYRVELIQWGKELYGSIGIDLGAENPVPDIPPGGIAYTNRGNYVCIFFGQPPAWPVEYLGQIKGDEWKRLLDTGALDAVDIEAG